MSDSPPSEPKIDFFFPKKWFSFLHEASLEKTASFLQFLNLVSSE